MISRKSPKRLAVLALAVASSLAVASTAFAFSDIKSDPGAQQIADLEQRGVVQGVGSGMFQPTGKVTGAAAVSMIVKGLGLNIDNIRFIKEPKASDSFTKVKDDAPYAQAFIIARLNGLDLPRDIDPSAGVTREQFAHWLSQGIAKKGDYAIIDLYMQFGDEDSVTDGYMSDVQKLLILKIASVDADGNFRPQDVITRSEAAVMLDKTIEFTEKTPPIPDVPDASPLHDIALTTADVADGVVKATISAEAPHPGYGLEVSSITFDGDQAIVNYRVTLPDPNLMYPQHVVTLTAEAFVSAKYKVALGSLEGASVPPSAGTADPNGSVSGDGGAASGSASGSTGFPISE